MKRTEIKVGIIDYNVGNVNSAQSAFKRLGYNSFISKEKDELELCSHLVLPGVGSFDEAMVQLNKSNLIPHISSLVFENKKPILGICVGMQLMFNYGLENKKTEGLGWVNGYVDKIKANSLKLPHVGWNEVIHNNEHLFDEIKNRSDFYFDHCYECILKDNNLSIGITKYPNKIICSIKKNNIYGVQFHPEKSQISGLKLLKNFIELC